MKFFSKIFILLLLISSCKTETKRDGYLIRGNAKGVYNGIRVYLKSLDQNNRQVDMDTAIVMNEKFTFEGKISDPEMVYVYMNSVKGNLPLIIENAEITIDIDKENLSNSKVSGTKSVEALHSYNQTLQALNENRRELNLAFRQASQAQDTEKTKSLNTELTKVNQEFTELPFEFIKNNNDNYFSLTLVETLSKSRNVDLNKVIEAYNSLSDNLKSSEKGRDISSQIETTKTLLEAQKKTEIGQIAPEFSAPNPEGKILGLKDVKGKITMIDFWAAWCGPCRRENPNIVKVYEKYHDKGLEIIGVSLDGNGRQQDPKAAWVKAIKDDNLNWHQVSNLKYFDGPIAKMYNIQSIPSSFILDAEGRIVAKNLRGPALEAKMAELLD